MDLYNSESILNKCNKVTTPIKENRFSPYRRILPRITPVSESSNTNIDFQNNISRTQPSDLDLINSLKAEIDDINFIIKKEEDANTNIENESKQPFNLKTDANTILGRSLINNIQKEYPDEYKSLGISSIEQEDIKPFIKQAAKVASCDDNTLRKDSERFEESRIVKPIFKYAQTNSSVHTSGILSGLIKRKPLHGFKSRYKLYGIENKINRVLNKMKECNFTCNDFDNFDQFRYYNFLTMSIVDGCTWSAIEKDLFFQGLTKFGFDVESIQKFVGSSKTVPQISNYLDYLEKGYLITLAESPDLLEPPLEQYSIQSTLDEIIAEEMHSIEEAEHEDLEFNNNNNPIEENRFMLTSSGRNSLEFFNSDRAYKILNHVYGNKNCLVIKSTWKEFHSLLESFLRKIISNLAINYGSIDSEKGARIDDSKVIETLDLMGIESSLQPYFNRILEKKLISEADLNSILFDDNETTLEKE
ncbi:hypothetical protein AYI70_g9701 [Smittium culicis]|uniref:Uncharacterized protein n=1 Tax=Smittium culicis TaxID=133412 RepID=A0A1R1XA19_9FUNG|nr:hypothetical protein AYI70_g9701 [Smittium culicis]